MTPNWDEDGPQLSGNLSEVLQEVLAAAQARKLPTCEAARLWQQQLLRDLQVPGKRFIGTFRGEPDLERIHVYVGGRPGVDPSNVAEELRRFETKLQALVAQLDALIPVNQEPDADQLSAILDACAWAHAEWIRIHPFANGNGRTARLWANSLALRYRLPPFVRLRPRPGDRYAEAGGKAMQGDWRPTALVFRRLLEEFLREP